MAILGDSASGFGMTALIRSVRFNASPAQRLQLSRRLSTPPASRLPAGEHTASDHRAFHARPPPSVQMGDAGLFTKDAMVRQPSPIELAAHLLARLAEAYLHPPAALAR